ncbi:hypothetical protein ACU686_26275 [Yinghuangia aomiensis]
MEAARIDTDALRREAEARAAAGRVVDPGDLRLPEATAPLTEPTRLTPAEARAHTCPTCHVVPGFPCRTWHGAKANATHTPRLTAARTIA